MIEELRNKIYETGVLIEYPFLEEVFDYLEHCKKDEIEHKFYYIAWHLSEKHSFKELAEMFKSEYRNCIKSKIKGTIYEYSPN